MKALGAKREQLAKKDEGFTLIELLVVVIIIGILAAIAIPVYIGVQNSAKESALQSDISNYKTAVVAYFTQTGDYPDSDTELDDQGYPGASQDYTTAPTLDIDPDTGEFSICGKALADGKTYVATESSGVEETTEACDGAE